MAGLQALSQVALMGIQPVLALFVETLLADGSSPARSTGIVFGITAACAFAGASLLGRWADRRGPVPVLRFCLLGAAGMAVPQALAQGIGLLTLGRAAMGFFIGGLQPVINSLVVREVPSERRGGLLGVTFSASLFGNAIGPFIGGAVAQMAGLRAAFWLTGALLLLSWGAARQFFHKDTGRGRPARTLAGEP
jgi:MFS family permease